MSNSEECERLIREAVDLLGGRIDILVNNAGITKEKTKRGKLHHQITGLFYRIVYYDIRNFNVSEI